MTNTVLAALDLLSKDRPLMAHDRERLKRSVQLLLGFLLGCVIAATAIPLLADWAWAFPVALAAAALAWK